MPYQANLRHTTHQTLLVDPKNQILDYKKPLKTINIFLFLKFRRKIKISEFKISLLPSWKLGGEEGC